MKKLILAFTLVILLTLGACTGSNNDTPTIQSVKTELTIDSELTSESVLPTNIDGIEIAWQSSRDNTLTTEFGIIQGLVDLNVTITAVLTYEDSVTTKIFNVVILRSSGADNTIINNAIDSLSFEDYVITKDITLPDTVDGISVTWTSNNETHLSVNGEVTRPDKNESDAIVILTASFSYNELVIEEEYTFTITAAITSVVFESYYSGAEALMGDALKTFLHELIDDHYELSYTDLWTALAVSDEDPNNSNNVILLYTGRSQLKTEIQSGNNYQDYWNREHVWPKAHGSFDTDQTEGTDMHHIRPTDVSVNAARGSLDFDYGGSVVLDGSVATLNLRDSNSFEPRDAVKGDVARMIFYMAVRYEGDNGELDLELNNLVNTQGTSYMGNLLILLEWSLNDPVDAFEMNRNEVIFGYQGNRNPFIDHPEFAEYIWGTN